jgi:hypothetical protein
MNNLEQALQEYLDKEYPLVREDLYYETVYSDIEYGKKLYRQEMFNWRNRVTPSFVAGYMSAFKEGNTSPNSCLSVISDYELQKGRNK